MVDLLPCLLHKSRFATGKHAACGGFGAVRGRVCPVSTGDAVALTSCRWSRGQNPGPPPSLRILSRWPELTRTTPQGTPRLERGLRTPQTSELPPGEGSGVWSRGSALPCQRRPPAALSCSRTHVRAHTRARTHAQTLGVLSAGHCPRSEAVAWGGRDGTRWTVGGHRALHVSSGGWAIGGAPRGGELIAPLLRAERTGRD